MRDGRGGGGGRGRPALRLDVLWRRRLCSGKPAMDLLTVRRAAAWRRRVMPCRRCCLQCRMVWLSSCVLLPVANIAG